MINLMIYINPEGFEGEFTELEKLTKLQIDNSLELGWNKKDLLLVTNFAYQYRGISSTVISSENVYIPSSKVDCATKIATLVYLFENNYFGDNLYWYHDFDAYQQEIITDDELGLDYFDAGFCDYQRIDKWQLGSFFFKKSAHSIFKDILDTMGIREGKNTTGINDEDALVNLTKNNVHDINSRIKKLNGRFDFGMRRVDFCFEKAVKPIKVLHFHPHNPIINTLAIAMYGKNRIGRPLMNERLIKIFHKYDYK